MIKTRVLKEVDKIEELGNKICRLVDYHERKKGRFWELVALADVLFAIVRILRNYEKRLTELEKFKDSPIEYQDINETGGVNKIKIILNDPRLRKKRGN